MSKVKISYEEAVKQGLTKKCSNCGEVKSVIEFNRSKTGKYGAQPKCKECMVKYNKIYRQEHREEIAKYRQEHREEMAKYNKQYNQERREEKAKYQKQYYQEHREEINNRQRKYNQTPQRKESQRKYSQTPQGKEVTRKATQKYKASKNNSFYQPFTQEDKEFCLNYFNHKCPYTGRRLTNSEIHTDHIVALSDKDGIGATAPWNLIVCDASANMSKQNKPILEFINSLPNPDEVYNKIRGYIILQAKKYIDIIPKDDITLITFNISFEEIEG